MREIKFRAKARYGGDWVYGALLKDNVFTYVLSGNPKVTMGLQVTKEVAEVIPETVGQFTGLHDKNGVEIYEGDILEVNFNDDCCNIGKQKAIIKYSDKHASFLVEPLDDWSFCGMDEGEVIGNIHEGGNECTSAIVE